MIALAAHCTTAGRLTATTVETVRFERPHQISFRLLRGSVRHVTGTVSSGTAIVRVSGPGRTWAAADAEVDWQPAADDQDVDAGERSEQAAHRLQA
jgi:hypothetical protein